MVVLRARKVDEGRRSKKIKRHNVPWSPEVNFSLRPAVFGGVITPDPKHTYYYFSMVEIAWILLHAGKRRSPTIVPVAGVAPTYVGDNYEGVLLVIAAA